MKRKAIVFDIDGVLLDTDFIWNEIEEKGLEGDKKWKYFYKYCNSGKIKIIQGMFYIYNLIRFYDEISLIFLFCTARNENNKEKTILKLAHHGMYCDDIYMRNENDLRSDAEVKRDLLTEIQKEYKVIAFIDDKEDNCNMAKSLGIFSLRVV